MFSNISHENLQDGFLIQKESNKKKSFGDQLSAAFVFLP